MQKGRQHYCFIFDYFKKLSGNFKFNYLVDLCYLYLKMFHWYWYLVINWLVISLKCFLDYWS